MRRREAGQGAAPAGLPRKQASGGPRVTVRPYYEGLPAMAGRGPDERRGNLPGSRAANRPCPGPEARSRGRVSRRGGAPEGAVKKLERRPALRLPSCEGPEKRRKAAGRLKNPGVRSVVFAGCLKNESERCDARATSALHPPPRGEGRLASRSGAGRGGGLRPTGYATPGKNPTPDPSPQGGGEHAEFGARALTGAKMATVPRHRLPATTACPRNSRLPPATGRPLRGPYLTTE